MSIGLAKPCPATYDDLVRLPEHVVGEIVDSELVVSPRPAPRHALASSALGGEVIGPFGRGNLGGPGGWLILFEPELHLGQQVLVPDLSGWRIERMPTLPDTAWFTVAPDWVCEVLSPSTAILDRTRKSAIYREQGVQWLWFVDPAAHTIEVLKRTDEHWILAGSYGGDTQVPIPPFEAVSINLAALWGNSLTIP